VQRLALGPWLCSTPIESPPIVAQQNARRALHKLDFDEGDASRPGPPLPEDVEMSPFTWFRRIALLALCGGAVALQQAQQGKPDPDVANAKYGPHERNVLDLWQAKSDSPTPLIVFIHGGGFSQRRQVERGPPLS